MVREFKKFFKKGVDKNNKQMYNQFKFNNGR